MISTPRIASSPGRSVSQAAFTLIELLTVIAIIGILAAIVIPVIGGIRDRAKAMECVSNLRQWSQAVMMFSNENKGKYQICSSAGGNGGTWWYQIGSGNGTYLPYIGLQRNYDLLVKCKDETLNTGSNTNGTACYLFALPSGAALNNISIRNMSNPSKTLMMVERSFSSTTGGFTSGDGYRLYVQQSTALANADGFTRHGSNMNAVFADGHMEKLVANGTGSNSWRGQTNGVSNSVRWLTY